VPDDEPYRLLADRAGTVWVGTLRRLWRITADGTGWSVAPFELFPDRPGTRARVQCLREDPAGAVWVGTHNHGLFRIGKDGRLDHRSTDLPESFFVRDLYFGEDGSVWTAFLGGVAVFDGPPFPGEPVAVFGKEKGLSIDTASLLAGRDGSVLVATTTGITEIRRGPAGGWSVGPTLDRRSGLPGDMVSWLLRDPQGNLWVSLMMRGLAKIPRSSFSRLAEAEEPGTAIVDLTRDRDGRVVALASRGATSLSALRVGGEPAGWFPLSLPSSMGYVGWAGHQKILCDSRGTWWIAVGGGVLRYDDPRRLGPARMAHPPDAVFSIPQGLPGGDAFTVGEDTHGDVWMSVQPEREGVSSVSRWIRATGRIETFSIAATGTRSLVGAFQPLRDGSMWIEFLDGRLVRHRQGRFQPIPVDARPEDQLGGLYADAAGRLWRSGRAVFACDHPEADEPRFTRRDIATGAWILSMTEDTHGRMWLGTNQGLLRHDPATGTTRRFTAEDGLPGNIIGLCARDDAGTLWFSDQSGLARLEPGPDPPTPAATARLREVRIAGEPIPLPANGATSLGVITVPPDRRRLAVEFFAVHHGPGAPPRFEYRLEGIDAAWSPPTADRSVQFAHLSPGTYRFLVRAVADDGSTKTPPASIGLHVLAPLWQRAWFLGLVAVTMGAAGYTAYRVRVLRIVAAERIRTRIATDLHDDIGSSLSQIAILSQIAHRQVGAAGTPPPEALQRITSVSGELIDAMSDVVWAISRAGTRCPRSCTGCGASRRSCSPTARSC
jgi:ligand-binding sensor domain-containing protein